MSNGTLYFVTSEEGEYVMTAPMHILVTYLKLHPDAVRRIERETIELGAKCKLHFGYGPARLEKAYLVQRLPEAIAREDSSHAEG